MKKNCDREVLEHTVATYRSLGSMRKTADALGLAKSTVQNRLAAAEKHGIAWRAPVDIPSGYEMGKTTVQYNARGEVVQEWRRLSPQQQALEEFAKGLCSRVKSKGRVPRAPTLPASVDDLMHEVVISDAHLGMLAWQKETGQDYDIDIGTRAALSAVEEFTGLNQSALGVLVFNGDTLHSDNRSGTTEHSGNVLDTDSRYPKTVDHAIDVIVQSTEMMARSCRQVRLIIVPGNHDWHTAVCLARVLDAYYRKCDRVDVVVEARPRKITVWGNVLLAHAHGDRIKAKDWQGVIAAEYPREWGATIHRYLHLGHIHHRMTLQPVVVSDQQGLTVEYLCSLCPPDAWHVEGGYVGSRPGAESFVYHREHGLKTRHYWPFSQLASA